MTPLAWPTRGKPKLKVGESEAEFERIKRLKRELTLDDVERAKVESGEFDDISSSDFEEVKDIERARVENGVYDDITAEDLAPDDIEDESLQVAKRNPSQDRYKEEPKKKSWWRSLFEF